MGIIISLLIMWLMFKILQWAFSSLSDSNNDKETSNHDDGAIDTNSNEEPSSYNVGSIDSSNDKETSNHNVGVIDDKPSDLKYDNEVYISFRDIVQKAYETYKKIGCTIAWDSDNDGFIMYGNDSLSDGSSIYNAKVRYDSRNFLKLNNPFYIHVQYGIVFDRRNCNDYEEKADYLNEETEIPSTFYSVETIEGTNFGVHYANFIVSNNENICEDAEELGELLLFERLFSAAKEAYYDGEEIYGDKIKNAKFSFISGSNSNKETASQTVEAIDSNNDHETSNHDDVAIDNEPSDLKYDNEVYISFRNKVRKAYESLKKSEYRISWESDMDGFVIVENDSPLIGDTVYAVNVRHDDQKLLELNDPFYIVGSYGIIFDRRDYNDYKEKADYLNDCETIERNIYYSVDTIKGTNFGIYYANIVATNNKKICEYTEELGEAELFKRLMNMAKKAWYEGKEIYGDKI